MKAIPDTFQLRSGLKKITYKKLGQLVVRSHVLIAAQHENGEVRFFPELWLFQKLGLL